MPPAFSRHLDLLRVLAAAAVLLSHFAYPRFSRGDWIWVRELNLGSDAVVLFFVLSGLVISWTAAEKDRTFGAYAFARLTRLWSVVLPALALTLVFDALGTRIEAAGGGAENYVFPWLQPAPAWEVLARGLLFSTEWRGSGFRPGTNGPFWSISYEAAYYLIFGLIVLAPRRWGWPLAAAALWATGVKPLALAPAWIMGVWLHRRGLAGARGGALSRPVALALAVLPLPFYAAALAWGLPPLLKGISGAILGAEAIAALRFSDEFLWNAALGLLVAAHLRGALGLCAGRADAAVAASGPSRLRRAIAWVSGAAFSIYLVHYPALQLLDAALPDTLAPLPRDAALLAGTVAICLLFAEAFERPLPRFRRALRRILPPGGAAGGGRGG